MTTRIKTVGDTPNFQHSDDFKIRWSHRRKDFRPTFGQLLFIILLILTVFILTLYLIQTNKSPCPMSKIALLTLDITNKSTKQKIQLLGKKSLPVLKDYCKFHGYDLIVVNETMDSGRPVVWTKILALERYLPQYHWILYIDLDAIIANPLIRIEDKVSDCKDVYVAEDISGLNFGVALLKNSEWTLSFLKQVYNHTESLKATYQEQHAFSKVLRSSWWNRWHATIYPPHKKWILQSYPKLHDWLGEYEEGHWIVHVPGPYCKKDNCFELFDELSGRARDIIYGYEGGLKGNKDNQRV